MEDFDTNKIRTTNRTGPDHKLIVRMATAFNRLLTERNGANDFAADAWRHLRQHDLIKANTNNHVVFDSDGTGFTQIITANTRQVRDNLLRLKIIPKDIDHFLKLLTN